GAGHDFDNTVLDDEATIPIGNSTAPFSGSFKPQALLSAFDGTDPNGTWQLKVVDQIAPDGGSLNNWSITFETGGETSVTTGAGGAHPFPNVAPGNYTIREVVQAGWTQTAPPSGAHSVSVATGQTVANIDFGNVHR